MTSTRRPPEDVNEQHEEEDDALFFQAMAGVRPIGKKKHVPFVIPDDSSGSLSIEGEEDEAPEEAGGKSPRVHRIDLKHVEPLGPLAVLSYVASDLPRKWERKLRKGMVTFAEPVDLHGMTWKEAEREVHDYIDWMEEEGRHAGMVIHGKGHGAVLGRATMKEIVFHYLKTHPAVKAVISARPKDGGLGAAYIWVR